MDPDKLDEGSDRKSLTRWVDIACKSIKSTIKDSESSELDLAQESWHFEVPKIDTMFEEIIGIAYQPKTDFVTEDGRRISRTPIHEPVVQLARRMIPIIKLVKIFYNKISRRGMNQHRFPPFTKMSSEQISYIAHSMSTFHGDVIELRLLLQRANERFGAVTDPIRAGFSRLMNKFQPSFYGKWTHYQNFFDDAFSALSIDQVRTQEELEHTIDQIKFIIAATCLACKGPLTSAPEQTDDHNCRGLKSYRLQRLELKFNGEVLYQINQVFTHAHELFQKTVPASDKVKPDKLDESSDRKVLAKWVDLASKSIKSTIKEFESSELNLAQESWQFELSKIDDIFGEIIHTAYQPGTDLVTEDGRRSSRAPVHEPVMRLAQGIVPIIKLVKIFYKKTSQRGMNQRRFPLFTKMSSQQILSMAHSIGTFHGDVLKLRLLLPRANQRFGAVTGKEFMRLHTPTTQTQQLNLASTMIESTIKLFEWSELDSAQENWTSELPQLDEVMTKIMHLAY
ncbi:hypothetical protein PSTT_10679 [Puccinia striiformis]|uniref:Uncharacterized protein n=1 Tax=Puccinia striiformis TaxID=27350 RepID=A0A2S4V3A5_9BASI|nr:hypothetical protein PSTT_10679 [Puccinia striiformis]